MALCWITECHISILGGATSLYTGEVKRTNDPATGWRVGPTWSGRAVDCEALEGELMVTLALYLWGRTRLHPFEFLPLANHASTPALCSTSAR